MLAEADIAQIVYDALIYGARQLRHYELHSWVIMSNHVHVLMFPQVEPRILLKSLKGITARRANAALSRTGQTFWRVESFDHWIRDDFKFQGAIDYIEANPVRAGLVKTPRD